MIAYKLFRERKNGTIGPLFIGRKQVIPMGLWLPALDIPTKGYAHRPGWHAARTPVAPHLSLKGRAWYMVDIQEFEKLNRPASQGTTWYIAKEMKVIRRLDDTAIRLASAVTRPDTPGS